MESELRLQQERQVWGAGYDFHFEYVEPVMPVEHLCKGITELGLKQEICSDFWLEM